MTNKQMAVRIRKALDRVYTIPTYLEDRADKAILEEIIKIEKEFKRQEGQR